MDFYLNCPPCVDCDLESQEPSLHLILLQICNLFAATVIDEEDADRFRTQRKADAMKTLNESLTTSADYNQKALDGIVSVLESISAAGKTISANMNPGNAVGNYVRLDVTLSLL
jgi:hypothetical protein